MIQSIFILLLLLVSSSAKGDGNDRELFWQLPKSIVSTLKSREGYSMLATLLEEVYLDKILTCSRSKCPQHTLFAPSDEALAAALPSSVLENPSRLRRILRYHIVEGRVQLSDNMSLDTIQGQALRVTGGTRVNDATIVDDIDARGGIIYFIDSVLIPEENEEDILSMARENKDLSAFVRAVEDAGLQSMFVSNGPFTLFCPTNKAFAKFADDHAMIDSEYLEKLLLYHLAPNVLFFDDLDDATLTMLEGDLVKIHRNIFWPFVHLNGKATVVDKDVAASNGVVQVIDEVLLPPPDLVARIKSFHQFTTFIAFMERAGLTDLLRSQEPSLTVFLPTNNAFQKLDPVTLENILDDPAVLEEILLYHVVPGSFQTDDLAEGSLATLQQDSIQVQFHRGLLFWMKTVSINGLAEIQEGDILATNGVVQSIDRVLLPPTLANYFG